ncbi:MAG: dipeptidase [Acetobacteraceae bacterium]|nr:dipeptidase [Acetobacteraceae bacterium]
MNQFFPPGAAALHHSLLTLDTHIDIPWPDGPDPFQDGTRRVDLPKMRRGGLRGGFFAAYIPQGLRTPEAEQAAFERAMQMLHAIRAMSRVDEELEVRLAATTQQIDAAWHDDALIVVPCVENGFAIGSDLSRLRQFRALGACYLTLTHNGHNALADSAVPRKDFADPPEEHGGLSALGRAAIAELNRLGMLVDVSHLSKAGMIQAATASRTPIVATHSCIRALCDHPRNLDDEQLDALRDCGGVVHVTAVPAFLKTQARPEEVTVADYADHIEYAVNRIGLAHVGISSDFDGGGGFVGWRDASESPNLTAALMRRGYDRDAIAALWGGNFLRVMRTAEEVAS